MNSRRHVRIYCVQEWDVLDFLNFFRGDEPGRLWVPVLKGPPRDAEILRINYDFGRMAFVFLVQHPSFEPVAIGCEPKWMNSEIVREPVEIVKDRVFNFDLLDIEELQEIRKQIDDRISLLGIRP
jgi:hypothetical protein